MAESRERDVLRALADIDLQDVDWARVDAAVHTRLVAEAATRPAPRRPQHRRWVTMPWRAGLRGGFVAVGIAVPVLIAVLAVVLLSGRSGPRRVPSGPAVLAQPNAHGRLNVVPPGELRAFPVLARPRTAADRIAAGRHALGTDYGATGRRLGVNPKLARLALNRPDAQILLVPARGNICVSARIGSVGYGGCTNTAQATQNGIQNVITGAAGTEYLSGVLPGSPVKLTLTARSGAVTTATLGTGGGYAVTIHGTPASLDVTYRDGSHRRISLDAEGLTSPASSLPTGSAHSGPAAKPPLHTKPDTSTYALFRRPSGPIPAALVKHGEGVERVLVAGRANIDAVATLMGVAGSTEVCVLLKSTTAVAGTRAGHLGGACAGPSKAAVHAPYLVTGGPASPAQPTIVAGIVPDGIATVTLLFPGGRSQTLTATGNAVAARLSAPLVGYRWTSGGHTSVVQLTH